MKKPSDYISTNLGIGVSYAPEYDVVQIKYSVGGSVKGRVLVQCEVGQIVTSERI